MRNRRLPEIEKVEREVTIRLKKEINYWDHRAQNLKVREQAGKKTRLSASQAEVRANELADRLRLRLAELAKERDICARPPQVRGGALVIPGGLLRRMVKTVEDAMGTRETATDGRSLVERVSMDAVMATERILGHQPRDVSAERVGYDVESRDNATGRLRFIEVKGRAEGANTVTVTRNEILTALNKPDAFILAIVEVSNGVAGEPRYVRVPFKREPDFGATSVTYKISEFTDRSQRPR